MRVLSQIPPDNDYVMVCAACNNTYYVQTLSDWEDEEDFLFPRYCPFCGQAQTQELDDVLIRPPCPVLKLVPGGNDGDERGGSNGE